MRQSYRLLKGLWLVCFLSVIYMFSFIFFWFYRIFLLIFCLLIRACARVSAMVSDSFTWMVFPTDNTCVREISHLLQRDKSTRMFIYHKARIVIVVVVLPKV